MRVACIVGTLVLLAWPGARIAFSIQASATTQSQENAPDKAPPQGAATQPTPPVDAPKDQSAPNSPIPTVEPTPCPENPGPDSSARPDCKPAATTKPKPKKHHRTHGTAMPPEDGPTKKVVRNGGTSDPTLDLSSGLTSSQASHQLESTNRLLAAANANLKKISEGNLTTSQQDTVKQIKSYEDQAKTAANGGDLQRAYNLAVKANLLSAELARH